MPCHNEAPRKLRSADPNAASQPLPKPLKWAIPAFLALIAGLLLFEHRLHLNVILPWLLLAACLVMHLFMHRGHGKHGHDRHAHEQHRDHRDGADHP